MKIIICPNYAEVSRRAARLIAREIMTNEYPSIGFATGSTPEGTYAELINLYKQGMISFEDVMTFNLDEYIGASETDDYSYNVYMRKHLFGHVNLYEDNINLLVGDAPNPEAEAFRFEKEIEVFGIDLQLLGIGANGHIGFNEPGTPFGTKTGVVNLSEKTIKDNARFFEDESKVPKQAISMGIRTIMNAKKIVLIASGKNKAEAVKKMMEGPVTEDVPASVLQLHNDCTVILEREAASLLNLKQYQEKI